MLLILEKKKLHALRQKKQWSTIWPSLTLSPALLERKSKQEPGRRCRQAAEQPSQDSPEVWEGRRNPHSFKTASRAWGKASLG